MKAPTLAEKKRLLIAESDAIRHEISLRLDHIEESMGWVEHLIGAGRSFQRSGSLIATLGGLLVALKLFRRNHKAHHPAEEEHEPGLFSKLVGGGIKAAGLIGPLIGFVRRMRA